MEALWSDVCISVKADSVIFKEFHEKRLSVLNERVKEPQLFACEWVGEG